MSWFPVAVAAVVLLADAVLDLPNLRTARACS
jgi:hypothetical protein